MQDSAAGWALAARFKLTGPARQARKVRLPCLNACRACSMGPAGRCLEVRHRRGARHHHIGLSRTSTPFYAPMEIERANSVSNER